MPHCKTITSKIYAIVGKKNCTKVIEYNLFVLFGPETICSNAEDDKEAVVTYINLYHCAHWLVLRVAYFVLMIKKLAHHINNNEI